ncbi:hypothetical protein ACOSQ3_001508 [Xanthoceras sorbifolium]
MLFENQLPFFDMNHLFYKTMVPNVHCDYGPKSTIANTMKSHFSVALGRTGINLRNEGARTTASTLLMKKLMNHRRLLLDFTTVTTDKDMLQGLEEHKLRYLK